MEVDSGRQPFCLLSLVQFMSLTSDIHVLPIFAPALKRGIDLSSSKYYMVSSLLRRSYLKGLLSDLCVKHVSLLLL